MKTPLIPALMLGALSLGSCAKDDIYKPSQTPAVQLFDEPGDNDTDNVGKPVNNNPVRPPASQAP